MERKAHLHRAMVACIAACYEAQVPALAVAEHCSKMLRYPEWTRGEVEQNGTRSLKAIWAMAARRPPREPRL